MKHAFCPLITHYFLVAEHLARAKEPDDPGDQSAATTQREQYLASRLRGGGRLFGVPDSGPGSPGIHTKLYDPKFRWRYSR